MHRFEFYLRKFEKSNLATGEALERQASEDQQFWLTDPDARSMATSGRGSGVVGYNVQAAVDCEHHLIVNHEVINVGNDWCFVDQLKRELKP